MMAAQLFHESAQMQESEIPDIFDVLEGGEDESAVKFLLGFSAEDGMVTDHVVLGSQQQQLVNKAAHSFS